MEEMTASPTNLLLEVRKELESQQAKEKGSWKNLRILAISIFIFFSLDLFNRSFSGVLLLVVVLLIHELGHLLGMKYFKYRDVQMFFIPLFGAAVSGTETEPSDRKKAIVSLLGPVPGILIGMATAFAYYWTAHPFWAEATRIFLFLNLLNLIPLHPLDGGRFFEAILFSRHSKLEICFKGLAGLALAGMAFAFRDVILGVLAFFTLVTLRFTYLSSSIAAFLKKNHPELGKESSEKIPEDQLERLVEILREKIPASHFTPQMIANYLTAIWQKIRNQSCSVLALILLGLIYVSVISLGGLAGVLFVIQDKHYREVKIEIVTKENADQPATRIHSVSLEGKSISEASMNESGLFDGAQTVCYPISHAKRYEGNWSEGYREGEWKFYDTKGKITHLILYERGTPTHYWKMSEKEKEEIPTSSRSKFDAPRSQSKALGIEDFPLQPKPKLFSRLTRVP